ncbi:hypothetical protein BDA99DRAFT_544421 [Phascolomyces articulosus]|uniref:Uncharacterized protein n=1 Tax=Phascolomyces articulosus TaxID=60185 RepID=A0AAD5P8C4_9FUNG|nr:hypothetical protein BDA99DRAFT_544421 [Phascolomyces articulosus]
MLGSLSNRDYDDYVRRHMNRLDHQADSIRNTLYNTTTTSRPVRNQQQQPSSTAILCEDPYCHQYPHSHPPPPSQRRRSNSTNTRQRRYGNTTHELNRHPSYHDFHEVEEDLYRIPPSSQWRIASTSQQQSPRRRRSSSISAKTRRELKLSKQRQFFDDAYYDSQQEEEEDWYHHHQQQQYLRRRSASLGAEIPHNAYYYDDDGADNDDDEEENDHDNNNDDDDDDDDDDTLNENELLAKANAQRNILVLADDPLDPTDPALDLQQQQQHTSLPSPQEQLSPLHHSLIGSHESLPNQSVSTGTNIEQQQQPTQSQQQPSSITTTPSMSTASSSSTPPKKKKGWLSYIFSTGRDKSSSPSSPFTPSPPHIASPIGRVHSIQSKGPLGDALDSKQQADLLRQLYNHIPTSTSNPSHQDFYQQQQASPQQQQQDTRTMNNNNNISDTTLINNSSNSSNTQLPLQDSKHLWKIANLKHVWVFRAITSNENNNNNNNNNNTDEPNVWITFDYINQKLLTDYQQKMNKINRKKRKKKKKQQQQQQPVPYQGMMMYSPPYEEEQEEGVEFFDSHIRQGKLPVLVLPSRGQAYYPTNMMGDEIISIQVACLPNTQYVDFVFRKQQH